VASKDKEKEDKTSEESKIIEFVVPTKIINPNAGLPPAYDLFCDQYGTPSTCINGIVVAIDGEEFHNKIAYEYYIMSERIFGPQSWEKAKRYFKILAQRNGVRHAPLRCYTTAQGIYYDTGTYIALFDGISVTKQLPKDCPVKFRRYKHSMLAPIVDYDDPSQLKQIRSYSEVLTSLLRYFNSGDFPISLLPTFFVDKHAQPIVCFTGAAGSAKTTFQSVIKRLVDPTAGEKINMRDDKNDWVTLWDKFYVLDFDNVRDIRANEADMLSRAVTGGSIIRRTLYTTSDVSIFSGKLRILMNGIRPEPSQFNDLLDRMLIVDMERITPEKRLSEEKFWEEIDDLLPEARYVCLDVAARAYKNMWAAKHKRLPRLGEFARLADAITVELGVADDELVEPGVFIEWYFKKISETANIGIEDNFANIMLRYLEDGGQDWFTKDKEPHTTHEWLANLREYCTRWDGEIGKYVNYDLNHMAKQKDFPEKAVQFGRRLTEIIPILQDRGFVVAKFHGMRGTEYRIYRQ
jgi:hypothetical protein